MLLALGDDSILSQLTGALSSPLQFVENITIETAWGPTLSMDHPLANALAPGEPGAGSMMAKILKPKITLTLQGGAQVPIAPYGEPGASRWPFVWPVLALGAVAAVVLGVRLLRR